MRCFWLLLALSLTLRAEDISVEIFNKLKKDYDISVVTLGNDSSYSIAPESSALVSISEFGGVFRQKGDFLFGLFPKVDIYKSNICCGFSKYKINLNEESLNCGIHKKKIPQNSQIQIIACDE